MPPKKKTKPNSKVDRGLGKPTTQRKVEQAHGMKAGGVEDLQRKVEHRPSVAQEKAAKEKAAAEAAAAAAKAKTGDSCG